MVACESAAKQPENCLTWVIFQCLILTCQDGPDPYYSRQLVRERRQRREGRHHREDCGRHRVQFTFPSDRFSP